MANLRPADAYYGEFTTQTPSTGAATAADSLPTATATRNGTDDATFTLTCASLATGRYKVTGTIPSGYAAGDALQISVSAVMGGVTGKAVIDSFVLDSKRLSDLNDLSSTQAATATQTGLTAQGYTGTLATNLGTTNTRVALALPAVAAGASGGLPLSVDASGRVDVLKINGTSQTARDIGASVLLSNGAGTGQLSLSAGLVTYANPAPPSATANGTAALAAINADLVDAVTGSALWIFQNTALNASDYSYAIDARLPASPAAVSDVAAVPAATLTALKADSQWKKLYAYSRGKFDFDPATGILRLYDVDNTTVLTTFTLTKDVSGNTTARTVS